MPGVVEQVRRELMLRGERPNRATVTAAVRRRSLLVGDAQILELTETLRTTMLGLGPIETLLADDEVTDVVVNGPSSIWVDRGAGMERTGVTLDDETAVRALAQRLAGQAGRRLDDAAPWVDAGLPGGLRLHAVLPPLAVGGTHISIRVLGRRRLRLADLVRRGSVSPAVADLLLRLVAAKESFLVTGGTGSGKTTVLGALLGEVAQNERIVVVEDSRELSVEHPHVVQLEGRPANVEGVGAVGLDVLLRQALRMRPDRIVVGEVRGPEVRDLLGALNTGHEGGCGTVHANSAADLPLRIQALGTAAGLPVTAAASQLAAAVSVVLHMRQDRGHRWLAELGLLALEAGEATVQPGLVVDRDGRCRPGAAAPMLDELLGS